MSSSSKNSPLPSSEGIIYRLKLYPNSNITFKTLVTNWFKNALLKKANAPSKIIFVLFLISGNFLKYIKDLENSIIVKY